jgi:hypothetical protein
MANPEQTSETPILDLAKPLPKGYFDRFTLTPRDVIALVLIVLPWVLIGNSYTLLLFIGVFLAYLVAVAIHELGHLVAGWTVGLRFEEVAIGPLRIEHKSGKWKFRTRRHLIGGFTSMTLDRIRRVRTRLIFLIAGGPIASFFSGAGALLASSMTSNESYSLVLGAFGCFSFWITIVNSLPGSRSRPRANDGGRLRTLLKSKEGSKQMIAAYGLKTLESRMPDPLLFNRRWARVASAPSQISSSTYHADLLAYEGALDSSQVAAAQYLERCLAGSALLDFDERQKLVLETAVFTAWYRGDASKADTWFTRVAHPEQVRPLVRLRAEVALHCAHRQYDEALRKWEQRFTLIQQLPGKRARLVEASWLEWRDQIKQRNHQEAAMKQTTSS